MFKWGVLVTQVWSTLHTIDLSVPPEKSNDHAHLTMSRVFDQIRSILEDPLKSSIDVDHWDDLFENVNPSALPLEVVGLAFSDGMFMLNEIFKQGTTAVYEIEGSDRRPSGVVLVYRQFCPHSTRRVSTVGSDFWFLRHLEGSGIVPRVYDISAGLSGKDILKVFGSFAEADGKTDVSFCPDASESPEIRYIVMEKLSGIAVYDEIMRIDPESVGLPISDAIALAMGMVEALRTSHSYNVIHGDAHGGNFIARGRGDYKGMKLIDFERARLFDFDEYTAGESCELGWKSQRNPRFRLTPLSSIWEAWGCFSSFRDDIHHVMVYLGFMMYGGSYFDFFQHLSLVWRNPETGKFGLTVSNFLSQSWRAFRGAGHIFEITGFRDAIVELGHERVLQVKPFSNLPHEFTLDSVVRNVNHIQPMRSLFKQLEHAVMSVGMTQRPDYHRILDIMEEIRILSSSVDQD